MNEDTKASDYEALYNRGLAWYDKGDYDAAIADYTAARKTPEPKNRR